MVLWITLTEVVYKYSHWHIGQGLTVYILGKVEVLVLEVA